MTEHNAFLATFDETRKRLDASGPDWTRRLRREGRARFEALGFPAPRLEQWKNTNVAPIAGATLRPARHNGLPSELPGAAEGALVFVDGRFVEELSGAAGIPDEVWAGSLARALTEIPERIEPHLSRVPPEALGAFSALNTAFLEDGGVLLVPDGVTVDAPIRLLHFTTQADIAVHPRTLIVVGRNSRAQVVETFAAGTGENYLINAVTDLIVGDNGNLEHYSVQQESERAFHVSNTTSVQGRDSRLVTFNADLGGSLVRHDRRAVLDGEGGDCVMNGLYLTLDSQHVDNHTSIEHAQPHCDSRELYKGIVGGESRTVFNGRIIVRQDAQKTDAVQSNPNLLLSDTALAHTRPQLEIYADDVKCTHGATVGRLEQEALFYLRSRGIGAEDARHLMISAFAGEVLDTIAIEELRDDLVPIVAERLARIDR